MKKSIFWGLSLMLLSLPTLLQAQRGGGWGKNCQYCTQYDVNHQQDYKGEILKVEMFVPDKGMGQGYEITIQTRDGEKTVHLGPVWYVNDKGFTFSVGDRVEVEGCEITFNGEEVIMAGEIERNGEKLRLRNEQGQPMWW